MLKNKNYYLIQLFIIIIYYLTGKLGLSLALVNPSASPVWPPTGIAITAFILFGYRIFPSILIASFLVNATNTWEILSSIGISTGNTLEGLFAAFLVKKFIKYDNIFIRPISILKFLLLAGVISTAISATFGVSTLALTGNLDWNKYGNVWYTWWVGNMGGALTVAPFLYLLFTWVEEKLNKKELLELIAVTVLFVILNVFIFFYNIPYPLAFISVPFLVWAALRFSLTKTSAGILILSLISILGTINGGGPFIHEDPNQSFLMIQLFIVIVYITVMPLAASVNQRKDLNEQLSQRELYFDQLAEISSDGIIKLNQKEEIVFANSSAIKIFGYNLDEFLGKKIDSFIPDFTKEFTFRRGDELESIKSNWAVKEFKSKNKYGKDIFVEVSRGFIKNGNINNDIFIRDITLRKTFENKLLKDRTEIDDFLDIASIGLNWINPEGIILNANQTELNLLGNSYDEYIGKNFKSFFKFSEDAEAFFKELLSNEYLKNFKTLLVHKDGSLKTVLINANIYKEDNQFIYARCFTRDITEQVRIEETNAFLAAIVESSNDAIIGKSADYNIISWNKGAEQIYGFTSKEILGKPVTTLVPEWRLDETKMFNENLLKGFEINQYETERIKKDGTLINVSLTISPIRDSRGRVIGASAIERDITDKIKSSQQLQNSLKEKELLLKEIHHRVKNNLQIISSLLSLQSQYISDPKTIEIFNESKNRVRTMALVHEKLYQSEDLLKVNFPAYISDLTASLSNAYNYKYSNVIIEENIEEISVSVDDIINLGLIINELITNSFKHGLEGVKNGRIKLTFKKEEGNNILLVKDNGKGLPQDFNIDDVNSLGLNLVLALVDQLNARLEFRSDGGTEFKVTIPERK